MPEKFDGPKIENKFNLKRLQEISLKGVKSMLEDFSKMPDSWIDPAEYHTHSDEEKEKLNKKRKNKFRVNYFHFLGGNLFGLIICITDSHKKEAYENKLSDIQERVRHENIENKKIPEELIDEIDDLAQELINIFENKKNEQ